MSRPLTTARAGATSPGMQILATAVTAIAATALAIACGGAGLPVAAPPPAAGETSPAERLEQFVRVRCATDGSDVFTTWRGHVWAYPEQEAPRLLFDVVGMNVARCARAGDGWSLTSRELMLYLDPESGQPLHRWRNPWTGREVAVAHVANSPVQAVFDAAPAHVDDGAAITYPIDVPLYYPNPLYADERTRPYSPEPMYRAGEFFTLSAPAHDVRDAARAAVTSTTITWHRVGPWLPWMAMGDVRGTLVYSATGRRVAGLDELDPLLRDEISERLPLYRSAPRCILAARNATSWTTFAADYSAYVRGERLPRPAPAADEPCAASEP